MKKVLLCLILSICMFVMPNLFGNVKAYTLSSKEVQILENNIEMQNFRNISDDDLKEFSNQWYVLRQFAKQKIETSPTTYEDYVILGSQDKPYLVLYKKSDVLENSLHMFVEKYKTMNTYLYLAFIQNNSNSFYWYDYYPDPNNTSQTGNSLIRRLSTGTLPSTYGRVDGKGKKSMLYSTSALLRLSNTNKDDVDITMTIYYDSSLPIYLRDGITTNYSNTTDYTSQSINLKIQKTTFKIITYEPDQMIIDEIGSFVDPINYEEKARYRYNELGENLSKVEVTFKEKAMAVTGQANFKINYIDRMHDPDDPNIIKITGYKIYGANTTVGSPVWEEITENEQEYFSNVEINKISDVEYEFSGSFNTPKDLCVHDQYRIEFYFENARYYDVTIYDDLKKSTLLEERSSWNAYLDFLADYRYYEIHGANSYVYISSNKTDNVGRIYLVANDSTLLGTEIYNYNFSSKELGIKYYPRLYNVSSNYYYVDFHFNYNNNEILFLKKEISSSTSNWIGIWVHKDYYVSTVMSGDDNFQYNTPDNGFQNGSNSDLDNIFYPIVSSDSVLQQITDFIDSLKNNVDYFNQVFDSFFSQLPSIVQNLCVVVFILILIFFLLKMGGWNS